MDKLKTIFFDKDGSRRDVKFSMKKERKKVELKKQQNIDPNEPKKRTPKKEAKPKQ
ncbi:hypothetical protein SAMN05660653_03106 [Desulfonatronum thiosulfatophilum]|uniref:Uncharacterized protein n=1 Tax=Desulfonatronum thiosulfatophilum TaxID=617002 RepID=A0A1G6ESR0_9BACT|nr:hypothetical protein [Desulfonatronum thiosulfatophilum]SDB60494.1 hypothetical protein SAMN05660653_03106 [Desulfonatronum thiosulfatophilum]